jgi:hypothetical protein
LRFQKNNQYIAYDLKKQILCVLKLKFFKNAIPIDLFSTIQFKIVFFLSTKSQYQKHHKYNINKKDLYILHLVEDNEKKKKNLSFIPTQVKLELRADI